MGRDNQPKARQRAQLARKQNQRTSHDRILIVCEGAKTEPNYFNEIRQSYRLPTANVVVQAGGLGTAPLQVVQYAKKLFEKGDSNRRIQPRAFEQVFAVFDRDDHDSYFDALALAESWDGRLRNDAKQSIRFQAIASVPSFELWLLLHFEEVHAPLHRDQVLAHLCRHLPGYTKGASQAFANTRERLENAIDRAKVLAGQHAATDAPEPYTAVGELVDLLTCLRS